MKLTKLEKWWLVLCLLCYGLYNLPGVPAYGDSKGLLIHAALVLIPYAIINFGGQALVNKQRKFRDTDAKK